MRELSNQLALYPNCVIATFIQATEHVVNPEIWTLDEVLARLAKLGYSQHAPNIREFTPEINGAKLLKLTRTDYDILGVDSEVWTLSVELLVEPCPHSYSRSLQQEFMIRSDLARLQLMATLPDGMKCTISADLKNKTASDKDLQVADLKPALLLFENSPRYAQRINYRICFIPNSSRVKFHSLNIV
jgi:hypothetical protein